MADGSLIPYERNEWAAIRFHGRAWLKIVLPAAFIPPPGSTGFRIFVWTRDFQEAEKFYSVEMAKAFARQHLVSGFEIVTDRYEPGVAPVA